MNEKDLIVSLKGMFEYYNKPVSEVVLKVYLQNLIQYPLDKVCAAINKLVQTNDFCPKVSNILREILPSEDDKKVQAMNEVDKVMKFITFSDKTKPIGDTITNHLMDTRFAHVLRELQTDKVDWFKREFVTAYINFVDSPEIKNRLSAGGDLGDTIDLLAESISVKRLAE